jgi:predicted metalloprotease with PDZ domain
MTASAIDYAIRPQDPAAHTFEVRCTVSDPDPAGQRFALPAWIPGSYLIRDFARHIVAIDAQADGQPLALAKIDKHTWQAAPLKNSTPITVRCIVYAGDLSVRGAHLDTTHAFFNGTSVFLRVVGHQQTPCRVEIERPTGKAYRDWRVATALEPTQRTSANGFGTYLAADYDELIDHPVEMGEFTRLNFTACGVAHEVAITGKHDADLDRLGADLTKICEWQIRFFGEPAPMKRYVFLVSALGEGYGGLEHRASTALICSRDDLPYAGMKGTPEGYRKFLGLASHEYFHTWNVKRIKPAAFTPYDLERENYTTLLWVFEGFTSYYDDLALLKSGCIELNDWLELTAKTLSTVAKCPGRRRQTLAESSFDAWSKFYRPDENTPNAVVSYYAKGALVALALDLTLREKTAGRVSLDDVMAALWARHGQTAIGVDEQTVRQIAEELSGAKLKRFFASAVDGTDELPLKRLLARFGITLAWEPEKAGQTASLGVKTASEGKEVRLATVYDGGAAQAAGLAAGDLLVAIDGLRVTPASLDALLARRAPGEPLAINAFRRDELMTFSLRLDAPPADSARLACTVKHAPERRAWLGA